MNYVPTYIKNQNKKIKNNIHKAETQSPTVRYSATTTVQSYVAYYYIFYTAGGMACASQIGWHTSYLLL